MDQPDNLKTKEQQRSDLVVRYIDDHKTICSFAMINKACLQSTYATIHERRKLLLCPDPKNDDVLGLTIHRWGSAYCRAQQIGQSGESKFALSYCELGFKNSKVWDFNDCVSSLPHKPAPFLNEGNEWCFDVYRKTKHEDRRGNCFGEIVRYNLSVAHYLRLKLRIGDAIYDMSHFQNNPSLTRSILSAKKANLASVPWGQFGGMQLALEHLEINLDDIALEPDWSAGDCSGLNDDVIEALKKHYKKQNC